MDLTDDILLQIKQEDTFAKELCHLSVNAISSQPNEDTIRLRALVEYQVMLTLMYYGNSTSFVTPFPAPPAKVKVADGSVMMSTTYVP